MVSNDLSVYFSGEKLYGDSFSLEEIIQWFDDEKEGYAELGSKDTKSYQYKYHCINKVNGFNKIKNLDSCKNILGIGSGYGHELIEFKNIAESITIIEPSDDLSRNVNSFKNIKYVKPQLNGIINAQSNLYDLVVCFGVLHHIPNVSSVMNEIYRVVKPGGYFIVREPIVSMGDWREKRTGLTKHERGIPYKYFLNIILECGFKIHYKSFCMFPIISKYFNAPYNNLFLTLIDKFFSFIFSKKLVYHRVKLYQRVAPTALMLVLKK